MASRLFFLCARGSGRALLAASLLQSTAGNRFEIWSAPAQHTQEQALIEGLLQEQGVAPSLQITSCSPRLACDGMRGSSCVVGWLRPDRSSPVPVGIVSGHSMMLPIQRSRSLSNWRPIAGFVRRSQDRLLWNFVLPAGCFPSFLNTSRSGVRSKEHP
jgi:hypothetical protein